MIEISTNVQTLGDALTAMAPFAGGSIPDANSQDYLDWISWVVKKQEEFARRAFWRRTLTRYEDSLGADDETYVLPDRFNRPNALFTFVVDGVDWNEPGNEAGQSIFTEMINDIEDEDFGKWQLRFAVPPTERVDFIMYYFANPPKPVALTDKLLLPGDMIAYGALSEYFRTTGAEGSQDDAKNSAEDLFAEYLGLEVLPDKGTLLTHKENIKRVDHLKNAKKFYQVRTGRFIQN